jgi:uncharacterized protein DUF4234
LAETVSIPGSSGTAKLRNPWGAFALSIVTLGIYFLVWYYKVNRELRDYGVGESPLSSLLALFPGAIILVPPFVTFWRFFGRVREAELRAGVEAPADQWLGFGLFLLTRAIVLPFEVAYAQQHLNGIWQSAARGRGADTAYDA